LYEKYNVFEFLIESNNSGDGTKHFLRLEPELEPKDFVPETGAGV